MAGRKILESPQVKVCGLTLPEQAAACAELGADAIGLVFHRKSLRNLDLETACAISQILPGAVWAVGVMVDKQFASIMEIANSCQLDAVQLHGNESARLVRRIEAEGLPVIKAVFASRAPFLAQAGEYAGCRGLLAECGRGKLAGGNALPWNWEAAAGLCSQGPFVLAGGLDPDNVGRAVAAALPDAVDASSGLEKAPGVKDLAKVSDFITMVRACAALYRPAGRQPRKIFGGSN